MSGRTLAGAITAAVAVAVAAGLLALGSPASARERRYDERRIEDLEMISRAVDAHRSQNGVLPKTLSEVESQFGAGGSVGDPGTQQAYEYRQIDGGRYELCAVFQQPSRYPIGFWTHASGRQCFKRNPEAH